MVKKKIFKWVGGKKWMKERLEKVVAYQFEKNVHIDTYIEPCAGGLGSFLSLSEMLISRGVKKVYLNDVNDVLIKTFDDIYKKNASLFKEYMTIEQQYMARIPKNYRKLTKDMKKKEIKENLSEARDFYIEKRIEFNEVKNKYSLRRSALFIFLMQHCFNGIYRENKDGGMNVPYNWEPKIANSFVMNSIFDEYKKIFSYFEIEFSSLDIFDFMLEKMNKILKNDWSKVICYIDPPYMNKKNNELSYSAGGFDKDSQKKLIGVIPFLNIENIIYSNYDEPIFHDFAKENKLKKQIISRNSRINPLNSSVINELLIYN